MNQIHQFTMTIQINRLIMKQLFIGIILIYSLNGNTQNLLKIEPKTVFESNQLKIIQITPNAYQHISYLQTNDYGNVPCNGLIVTNNKEAVVFDTPVNDSSSNQLIAWIKTTLQSKIKAIVPTHFHNDCLGGLKAFHENHIPSFANTKTIDLAKSNNYVAPTDEFNDSTILTVGKQNILIKYFGEGHTKDNVVAYFPNEELLFGGCLIKELDASKGYLGDANTNTWSTTVMKIKKAFPNLKTVIPGHGEIGDTALLDYTIQLFKN